MPLRIYNSLTGRKEDFKPIVPGKVRIYVCGMTVYDYCHLGHARVMVVFDMITRYLRARGFDVTYVRNITDIDDKIIKRASENGESIETLTERYVRFMDEDAAALGVIKPDHEPRATQYVPQMLSLIKRLEDKRLAYSAADGDVNYSVRDFPDYGKLSGKSLDELRAGERVEVNSTKRDPLDFVLWKHSKQGEPAWDSPWGKGRPGWHLECSAMSCALLGEHFDIHGGGQDLQFPHHENEIAQSEGASGRPFVNYWMHNGFVRVDDEKMSKSLGNFFTVREVLARYRPEEVRYFLLGSHYRSPLNHSDEHLNNSRSALTRLYTALRGIPAGGEQPIDSYFERFQAVMDDDFNTPEAVAVLFDLAREINRARDADPSECRGLAATLKHLGGIMGLLQDDPDAYLRGPVKSGDGLSDAAIDEFVNMRTQARKRKDWKESDRIRDLLAQQGIILEDGSAGTTWRRGG
ncbi:MAG: cysteine--tRNA ligase [Chromatiales bacterium]